MLPASCLPRIAIPYCHATATLPAVIILDYYHSCLVVVCVWCWAVALGTQWLTKNMTLVISNCFGWEELGHWRLKIQKVNTWASVSECFFSSTTNIIFVFNPLSVSKEFFIIFNNLKFTRPTLGEEELQFNWNTRVSTESNVCSFVLRVSTWIPQ